MKRCPKCNRAYRNDTQKFCTKDGISLVDAEVPDAGQGETIRIDSAQLNSAELDDEITKAISRDMISETTGGFDPYKTVVARPDATAPVHPRDTQGIAPSTPPPSGSSPPVSSGPVQ